MTEVWLKELQKVAFLFSYGRTITATLDIAATLHFSLKGVTSAPLSRPKMLISSNQLERLKTA